jgi:hypothetical protein
MKTSFLICILALSAFCNQVKLSDYTAPNDNLNDSPGLQKAIDEIAAEGGGTLIIDAGRWNLNGPISLVTYKNVNNSFAIKGQKGAVILPSLAGGQVLFNAGNQNQVSFEDLVVIGDSSVAEDLDGFVHASYVEQLRITGCQFFGLKSRSSLIDVGNTDAVVRDTLFMGISAGDAVIKAENFRGLSVFDSQFIDYGNLNGAFYSKTYMGVGAWIRASADSAAANAISQRPLVLHSVRFDEGANIALDARGVSYIQADGIMSNVSSLKDGAGFNLDNVDYAEIKMSKFGYTKAARPAVRAMNNTVVYVDGMTVGNGVFSGVRDSGSQAFFNLRSCTSGCEFQTQ